MPAKPVAPEPTKPVEKSIVSTSTGNQKIAPVVPIEKQVATKSTGKTKWLICNNLLQTQCPRG